MTDIDFDCFRSGRHTLFSFFPNDKWDEDHLTLDQALQKYPISEFNWLHIGFENGVRE